MRAIAIARLELVGSALVQYDGNGYAVFASCGTAPLELATHVDVVRVRRLIAPEKMSRAARRKAA